MCQGERILETTRACGAEFLDVRYMHTREDRRRRGGRKASDG
jgi:hypothetical protein